MVRSDTKQQQQKDKYYALLQRHVGLSFLFVHLRFYGAKNEKRYATAFADHGLNMQSVFPVHDHCLASRRRKRFSSEPAEEDFVAFPETTLVLFLFFFWRTSRTRRTRNGSGGFCIHVSLSFRCVSVLLCPRSVSDDFYPGANRLQQGVAGDKEETRGKFHRWRRFFFLSPYSFCARISAFLRRSSESARDRATSLPVCQQAATPRRAFSFFHVADMFARHAVVPVVTGGTD